jgi:hypothetical protein
MCVPFCGVCSSVLLVLLFVDFSFALLNIDVILCFVQIYISMLNTNSEVENVSNVIIIQKANTKSTEGQQWPPTNVKVGSGAMDE